MQRTIDNCQGRQWRHHGRTGGFVPPNPKSRQKFTKKNGIKISCVYLQIEKIRQIPPPPPFLSDFSELALPLRAGEIKALGAAVENVTTHTVWFFRKRIKRSLKRNILFETSYTNFAAFLLYSKQHK